MNLKLFGTGLAALAFLASFVLRASGRHTATGLQGHSPGGRLLQLDRILRRHERRLRLRHLELVGGAHGQQQAQGLPGRRHAWLQLPGRLDRLRPRGRLRLVGREGHRRLRAGSSTCETSNDWLATFRGRIGYAFDRWLPYITGGGAYGNVKATVSVPIAGLSASASNNQFGWTVGAGLEYAFLGNWTAKIEYLYVDLGSFNSAASRRS